MNTQHVLQCGIHFSFGHQALFESIGQFRLEVIEEPIETRLNCGGGTVFLVGEALVSRNQQSQRATVGTDDAVVAPLLDHNILEHWIDHHGSAVPRIVGSHYRARSALLKSHAERN